jgi:hypothetical protein
MERPFYSSKIRLYDALLQTFSFVERIARIATAARILPPLWPSKVAPLHFFFGMASAAPVPKDKTRQFGEKLKVRVQKDPVVFGCEYTLFFQSAARAFAHKLSFLQFLA